MSKVNGYIFRGSDFAILLFAMSVLKENLCSSRSEFIPSKVDPIFDGILLSMEAVWKS